MQEVGALAASLVLDALAGTAPLTPEPRLLPAALVPRHTVAAR
jgi:DNA-binding LacI/PurR family transcriptional regulator